MEYKGLYISYIEDNGVEREVDGVIKPCEGLYFQVYADSDMQYEIDFFCGAFGIDIENNDEAIEKYAKEQVDGQLSIYLFEKQKIQEEIKKFQEEQKLKIEMGEQNSTVNKTTVLNNLSEERVRTILDNALYWLSETERGSVLYKILSKNLEMTNEEIENEGFNLEIYYEDDEEMEI